MRCSEKALVNTQCVFQEITTGRQLEVDPGWWSLHVILCDGKFIFSALLDTFFDQKNGTKLRINKQLQMKQTKIHYMLFYT